jgi:hypothetical protein
MKFVVENDVLVKVEVENNEKCKVVDIPEGVKKIGAEAFGDFLWEVEKLYVPKSVEKIDDCAFFTEIAISNDLKEIDVDKDNEYFEVIDNCLIEKNTKTLVLAVDNSKIPQGVKVIGNYAMFFSDISIREIDIPVGVEKIGWCSLMSLSEIDIKIPSTVMEISDGSFGCFVGDLIVDKNNKNFAMKDNCLFDVRNNQILYCHGVSMSIIKMHLDNCEEITAITFSFCEDSDKIIKTLIKNDYLYIDYEIGEDGEIVRKKYFAKHPQI